MNKTHERIKNMTVCALFAAIICLLSPHSIPIGPIPITLATFAVSFSAVVLGWKRGSLAVILYLLIGSIGLPVFSGYKAGVSVLLGVTGGYATSYIFMALIIGFAADLKFKKLPLKIVSLAAGLLLSLFVLYAMGTVQYVLITHSDVRAALAACVLPFMPFDTMKLIAASVLGSAAREALVRAKIYAH